MSAQRPTVLVPTLMANASSWAQVVAAISGRILVPVELPGHGLRRNEDFFFDGSTVHLVGSGLGAAVALSATLAEPTRALSVLVAGFAPTRGASGKERLLATQSALTRLGTEVFVEGYLNEVLGPAGDSLRAQLTVAMSTVRPKVIVEAFTSALTWAASGLASLWPTHRRNPCQPGCASGRSSGTGVRS